MTITAKDEYQATLDVVYNLLTDQEFLRKKYEAIGSSNLEFQECRQKEDIFRIRWTREVPANPPDFLKNFISPWNKLHELMEWQEREDGVKTATYKGRIKEMGITITGKFLLSRNGDGCVESIEMKAEVPIPFVGDKIAKLVEQDTQKNLQGEYQFTREHLGEV